MFLHRTYGHKKTCQCKKCKNPVPEVKDEEVYLREKDEREKETGAPGQEISQEVIEKREADRPPTEEEVIRKNIAETIIKTPRKRRVKKEETDGQEERNPDGSDGNAVRGSCEGKESPEEAC